MAHQNASDFGLALINGAFCAASEAQIPLCDRGFLFGQAVFETILIRNGKIIDLTGHLSRLILSCKRADIALDALSPQTTKDLASMALMLVDEFYSRIPTSGDCASAFVTDAQMRVIVTGGSSFSLHDNKCKPHFYLYCNALPKKRSESQLVPPVSLKLVANTRHPSLVGIKSTHYLPAVIALREASIAGFADALYFNDLMEITETTTANFIWEDHCNKLWTAPAEGNCLRGTTLALLQGSQARLGQPIMFKALRVNEIATNCRSAYLISSVRRVRPVDRIEHIKLDTDWGSRQATLFNQRLDAEGDNDASHHFR